MFADLIAHAGTEGAPYHNFGDVLLHFPDIPVAVFIAISLGWSTAALFSFHLYLIALGRTTSEDSKNTFGRGRKNPYTSGFFRNAFRILFGPDYPSYVYYNWIPTQREVHLV